MGYKGEKLCVFCRYFYMRPSSPEYSEYTPGSDAEMICELGKTEDFAFDGESFRKHIFVAEDCDGFKLPDELLREMK